MEVKQLPRLRWYGSTAALLAESLHLAWEQAHGGILRHHLLNRADLPAISNGWGLVLLPALAWFLIGRIQTRDAHLSQGRANVLSTRVVAGFTGSLLIGMVLSSCFANGHARLTEVLFQGLLVLALLLPVYRAECVLGFVLGMTFVFGAVLPAAIASLIAAGSALVHGGIRPLAARLWLAATRRKAPIP